MEDFSRGANPKNFHRDILTKILGENDWPPFYWADIPMRDPKTGHTIIVRMPFLLPHEVMARLHGKGKLSAARTRKENAPPGVWKHCEAMAPILQVPHDKMFAAGLHGDGAPCGAKDSLEHLSWNLPCWEGEGYAPRFLIWSTFKDFVVKDETYQAAFEVIAWSFKMLACGIWHSCRHDGSAWNVSEDKWRSKQSGALPCVCCLVQLRGDWAFLKEMFRFPAWNGKAHMCWLCGASQGTFKDASMSAPWRFLRYSRNAFLEMLRAKGVRPCPIFSVPGMHPGLALPDWLHSGDAGVAADCLGQLFWEMKDKMPGNNQKERVQALWHRTQAWYDANKIKARLGNMTAEMIRKDSGCPKLRGKASQIRALVPFAAQLALEFCSANNPHENTVKNTVLLLAEIYSYLDVTPWPAAAAATATRKFVLLYRALETEAIAKQADSVFWRVKPKFHLFIELVEFVAVQQGSPKAFWTYRDEDFGGQLSKLAARRGGVRNPATIALQLLRCFCCLDRIENLDI